MLRRLLREQLQRIEQGLAPINAMRDPSTILLPTEAAALPYNEDF